MSEQDGQKFNIEFQIFCQKPGSIFLGKSILETRFYPQLNKLEKLRVSTLLGVEYVRRKIGRAPVCLAVLCNLEPRRTGVEICLRKAKKRDLLRKVPARCIRGGMYFFPSGKVLLRNVDVTRYSPKNHACGNTATMSQPWCCPRVSASFKGIWHGMIITILTDYHFLRE